MVEKTAQIPNEMRSLMAEDTIFSKIIRREIPAEILYQDELVTAFRDIHPQAPTHLLIVTNRAIPTTRMMSCPKTKQPWGASLRWRPSSPKRRGWMKVATASSSTATVMQARKSIISTCTCSVGANWGRWWREHDKLDRALALL